MVDPVGTPALVEAILRLHGAEATHVGSVGVSEVHGEQVVWQGYVQVFTLTGHGEASRAYAWSHEEDERGIRRRIVVVLETPPIDGPSAAVKAAIVAEARSR